MKRLCAPLFLLAVAAGCATVSRTNEASRYAELEQLVGQQVILSGFWSARHEATGIYFGRRDYGDAPKRCVAVDRGVGASDGSRVRIIGTLEKSGCGADLICLTVCQPYVLKNARLTG